MSAIETCRTAALGGHVERCRDCGHDRHRLQLVPQPPLSQVPGALAAAIGSKPAGRAAAGRLLSTSSSRCRRRSPTSPCQNKAVLYDAAVPGRRRDAAHHRRRSEASRRQDRRHHGAAHLGPALHPSSRTCTASSPAAASAPDGERWISCRPGFFLPVRVLSRLFRRLVPGRPRRRSCGGHARLPRRSRRPGQTRCLRRLLAPLRRGDWVVYAKRPFGGPSRCSRISPATPTASPSPTAGSSPSTDGRRHLPLEGLSRATAGKTAKTMTLTATSSSAASCSTSCPTASTASATTACSPQPARRHHRQHQADHRGGDAGPYRRGQRLTLRRETRAGP